MISISKFMSLSFTIGAVVGISPPDTLAEKEMNAARYAHCPLISRRRLPATGESEELNSTQEKETNAARYAHCPLISRRRLMVCDEEMRCARIARRRLPATTCTGTYDSHRRLVDDSAAVVAYLDKLHSWRGEMLPCPIGNMSGLACWACNKGNHRQRIFPKTLPRANPKNKKSYDCETCKDEYFYKIMCRDREWDERCDLCCGKGEIRGLPKNEARYLGKWNVHVHSKFKRNKTRFFFFNERTEELVYFKITNNRRQGKMDKGEKLNLRNAEIKPAVSEYSKENKWEDKSGRWVTVTNFRSGTTMLELAHVNSSFFDWSGDKKDTQDIYDKLDELQMLGRLR